MSEIRDRCSYCHQPIEYLDEIVGQEYWRHVEVSLAHSGLIPCAPRVDREPRVELALDELDHPRPSLMLARNADGTIVGTAVQLPDNGEWLAFRSADDRVASGLSFRGAYTALVKWATEKPAPKIQRRGRRDPRFGGRS